MKNLFTLLLLSGLIFQLNAQEIEVEPTQLTLVTKRTADWCPPCGAWGWSTFDGILEDNGNRAIALTLHYSSSDFFYTPTAQDLISNMDGSPGRPGFIVNEEVLPLFNESAVRDAVKERVDANFGSQPVAQTGLLATIHPETNAITVNTKTKFFQSGSGEYYLSLFFVTKSVIAYQASQGNNADHKNVLVTELGGNTFGELIAEGEVAADATFDKSYTLQPEELGDLDNVKFVTVLWKKEGDNYHTVNTNFTDDIEEEMISSLDETAKNGGFAILPNIITNSAQIELTLNEKVNGAEIAIFDINGKKVNTLFSGNLDVGVQHLEIKRSDVAASGIYFVQLRTATQQWSKKVFFE